MSQDKTTKEKIIIAAKELFLQYGFAGASMGQIGKLAGVNHSLLFYHFKNKKKLWTEVKLAIAYKSGGINKLLPSTDLKFSEFLHQLFANAIEFYSTNPELVRMLGWQRLESNAHAEIGASISRRMKEWIDRFTIYQNKGEIKQEIKPEFIVAMILSLSSSAALDYYFFISDKKILEAYIDFCSDTVLKAVE